MACRYALAKKIRYVESLNAAAKDSDIELVLGVWQQFYPHVMSFGETDMMRNGQPTRIATVIMSLADITIIPSWDAIVRARRAMRQKEKRTKDEEAKEEQPWHHTCP